jgi:hypothetical protein
MKDRGTGLVGTETHPAAHYLQSRQIALLHCHFEMSVAIEKSPYTANCLTRYLPTVDMTHRGGEDDKRKNLPFVINRAQRRGISQRC